MPYGISRTVTNEDHIDFLENMPHGSGIDADWAVSEPKDGRYIYFHNSFHLMDENGFYAGWQDFKVRFLKSEWEDNNYDNFEVQLSYPLNYEVIKQDAWYFKDYLYQTIDFSLNG